DEGRKWKYYTLTRKGKNIFATEAPANVLIVLGVSVVVMVGLLYGLLLTVGSQAPVQFMQAESRVPTITESPYAVPCIAEPAGGEYETDKTSGTAGATQAGGKKEPDKIVGATAVDQNAPAAAGGTSGADDNKNGLEIIGIERKPSASAAETQYNAALCPAQQCPLQEYSEPPLLKIAALVAAIVIVALLIGFTASKARKRFR
ncbi:MAG: hypothetical protein Q8N60_02035, partial [Candidatus Diapherotrites archaeon]|nr:hypothetical protein [Candidatus Diapherotrites archaeon]